MLWKVVEFVSWYSLLCFLMFTDAAITCLVLEQTGSSGELNPIGRGVWMLWGSTGMYVVKSVAMLLVAFTLGYIWDKQFYRTTRWVFLVANVVYGLLDVWNLAVYYTTIYKFQLEGLTHGK